MSPKGCGWEHSLAVLHEGARSPTTRALKASHSSGASESPSVGKHWGPSCPGLCEQRGHSPLWNLPEDSIRCHLPQRTTLQPEALQMVMAQVLSHA